MEGKQTANKVLKAGDNIEMKYDYPEKSTIDLFVYQKGNSIFLMKDGTIRIDLHSISDIRKITKHRKFTNRRNEKIPYTVTSILCNAKTIDNKNIKFEINLYK